MKEILPHKTEDAPFKLKEFRKDYVSVVLDKDKTKNLIHDIHVALSWAIHKAGVQDLDVTLRETEGSYEIIIET